MSAFECVITPTRNRIERKRNEDREPTIVDLRPFTGKSIVTFEDVPITKTARRLLIVSNSFDEEIKVTVTKFPKPEHNVALEWNINKIEAQGSKNLELIWNPMKVVSIREMIQICDDNGNKKDIAVILKSCEIKKTSSRRVVAANYPKKLKLKTPSPPNSFARFATNSKPGRTMREVQEQNLPLVTSPLRNTTNILKGDAFEHANFSPVNNFLIDKENTPETPRNASDLFKSIRFTPLTEKKPKCESKLEYLASLPTPVAAKREDIVISESMIRRNILTLDVHSPDVIHRPLHEMVSQKLYIQRPGDHVEAFMSTTDEINEIESVLNEPTAVLSNTRVLSAPTTPLCSISEEEAFVVHTEFHKTFEINKSRSFTDIHSPNKAARVASESMREVYLNPEVNVSNLKSNQGSMPNLNDINAATPIEHNRYFHQHVQVDHLIQDVSLESIVSHADFCEIEICAQSSRLYLNELGSPSRPCSAEQSKMSIAAKLCEDSPNRNVSYHASPTLRRIQQEPEFRSPPKKRVSKMTFSPPAHSKLSSNIREIQRRETFDVEGGGRQIRASTWKQQQNQQMFAVPRVPRELNLKPATNLTSQSLNSLSSSSVASISSTCSVPASLTSGRLYNENYVNAYSRKDPFSATTTNDPFLTATMYLDEQTLDDIEKTYKKWLNALVTIPPDLETDKNEKVDVGKLFNDVQSKELTLAPTKEAVCSRYYTSRLDTLRSQAIQFFHSESIAMPLNKLTVVINDKNKLDIKAERNIHLDLVLQRSLLELLLCYNPLWLRIGLEVIFNVQLNLTSNRDIYGMSRFIINYLFKSQYLAEKYSKFSQQNEYLDKLRKFTAKNFLFVIFFLDRAKESRLIKQNPCLFAKKAPYKESAEILKKFASLVLANYGDIIRTLRRYDYIVSHKQTVIDEFDFAFKNLAVDLRDGVRLTKVMEIILLRDDLVQKVRVPAISRLQKVHNVELALKALEAADYQIQGKITSKDIADGHREKTLSLLWQIIYKFRAPRFNAAAETLQKFWRAKFLMVIIDRRIKEKEEQKLNRAATVIQKFFRAWKARKEVKVHREKVVTSCTIIQKTFRSFIARRNYKKQISSVITIQRWFRKVLVVKEGRTHFKLQRTSAVVIQKWWRRQILIKKLKAASVVIAEIKNKARVRYESAVIIQRTLKSIMIHKKLHAIIGGVVNYNRKFNQKNLAATKIQSIFRMRRERSKFIEIKQSTLTIQQWWRHKDEGRHQREAFVVMKTSTIKIQQWFRGVQVMRAERSEFLHYRQCVVKIQRKLRATLEMKKQCKEFLEMKSAATVIQQHYRGLLLMRKQQAEYKHLKKATIAVQRRLRANIEMKVQRRNFLRYKKSCVVLQRKLRATILMEQERTAFLVLKMSVVSMQHRYRAQLAMRREREKFVVMKRSAIAIQQRFRAQLAMKKQRESFLRMKHAAIIIQQKFRATQLMKKEREHYLKLKKLTIHFQQKFRSTKLMRVLTVEFYSFQVYTIVLQQKFRAKLAMRKTRSEFLVLKQSTIVIQHRFRAMLAMKKTRSNYQAMKVAAVTIQRKFRATLKMRKTRKDFIKLKNAAIAIQHRFRANKICKTQRTEYAMLRQAVRVIETRYRAKREMEKARSNFHLIKSSIIRIQRKFRATLLMRQERNRFLTLRKSTMIIQQHFRGYQSMITERSSYNNLRLNVVNIQRRFRAQQLMKQEHKSYHQLKTVTINIQQRFRAQKEMKIQLESFTKLKSSTISIQRKLRATLLMQQQREAFVELKASTITIQQKLRATLAMKKQHSSYQQLKRSVVNVQQRFRANNLMKLERRGFETQKIAAVKIQRYFRGYLKMQQERKAFTTLQSAVVNVQTRLRATIAMREQRNKFLEQKCAAMKIQSFWRRFKKARADHNQYNQLKDATIKIQRRFRANVEMKNARRDFLKLREAALKIQQVWRATLEMRKQRKVYLEIIEQVVVIQQRHRANLLMKTHRENYLRQKSAAVTIQRWFRSTQLMLIERKQFLSLKRAVLLMENRILANKVMEMQRKSFLMLRDATIFVQQRIRSKMQTRQLHKEFKETRMMVVRLQSRARGYQARQRFEEMKTPEQLELRRQHKAARTIQASYRGYRERSKNCNRCFKSIVQRLMKLTKNVNPAHTLAAKLKTSIDFLKYSYDSNNAITFLAKLEYMSRIVPWILIEQAEFVSLFCYGLMAQAIRSEVDKQIIELCSCIILNLSRYKDTKEDAFQEYGLKTVSQMLMRWCDKDCGIFNTLCTLLWVFSQCELKRKIIRKYMLETDGDYVISQIHQNVSRKENMRKNSRRPIGFQSISLVKYKKDYQQQLRYQQTSAYSSGFITAEMLRQCREMPSIEPDYGVVKTMPYIFYSSVFAFNNVLKLLNIKNP